ncbi:hypothetical protein KKE06_05175 [Candidatus Micrarchaeota archaeon]|nr:hypothetical protein [Candidatus Micrarchaeota archaeon]MBU1930200.1 hypothetical protein [Candidatus Micrarchaeota archaeon]
MTECYGVDIAKPVTPEMVRDAIVKCYLSAHEGVLKKMKELTGSGSPFAFEAFKQEYVEVLIRSMFRKVGGDFDQPTKESLTKVVKGLKAYSRQFRDLKTIEKHVQEIMQLIEKI